MIYYKRCTGKLLPQKTTEQSSWVKWTHHAEGKTHCPECLMLDGCFFTASNHPPCPHHPFCHCTLEPVDHAVVLINASAYSDYRKFDPYLFNTTGLQTHNKKSSSKNGDILSRMQDGYKQRQSGRRRKDISQANIPLVNQTGTVKELVSVLSFQEEMELERFPSLPVGWWSQAEN